MAVFGNSNPSRYPNGFGRRGVSIRGVPILSSYPNKVFWVHSGTGAAGNDGSENAPFATIDRAFSFCTANRGDVIMVKAGHAETIAAAAGIAADVAGVSIIGLGSGTDMPEITFATAAGADINIDAANITIKGIRFICAIANMTAAIDVNADDFTLEDNEFYENAATGLTWVDINGGAANACDRAKIVGNRFYCTTAGNWDRAIELGEVADGVEIVGNVIIGDFDDAAIHNITGKVLTNLMIANNYVRNNQAGQHAIELVSACTGTAFDNRLVTDVSTTAFDAGALACMGNLWNATTGGDTEGQPVNPVSDVATNFIGVDDADNAAATTNVVANEDGSILERLEQIQEATNKGSGTALAANESLVDVLYGTNGIVAFPTAAAAANGVSVAEVLRYISEYQVPRIVSKAIAAAGTSLTTGLSPVSLFTVTGNVKARVYAVVTTALASTLNNGTLAIGVTGNTGGFIAATTADGTNFPTNAVWAGDTSPTLLGEVLSNGSLNWVLLGNGSDIICTIATNSMTAGQITFYCEYIPLDSSSTVVAA